MKGEPLNAMADLATLWADHPQPRVLIVDDLPDMRSAMRRIVETVPRVFVDLAANGEDAIDLIAGKPYDVVLCDYNLGDGKDGQQVLEEVRHRQLLGVSSAFLMITAEVERPMVLGALEYHPDEYLVKPIQRDVALRRIGRAVHRRRDMRELDEALSARDHARAIAICDRETAARPNRAHDLLRIKAELFIVIGDYEQAEALFRQVLAERELQWARFGLGRLSVLRGDFAEGQDTLERLIDANRYHLEPYDWLATAQEALGDHLAAQAALQTAIELSPKSVRRQRRLGQVAERNGDVLLAESAYRRAIREGKNSCFASADEYLHLSELLDERYPSKSLAVLREGRMGLRPLPDEELRIAIGQVHAMHGRRVRHDAQRFLDQALEIYDNCTPELPAESHLALARACFLLGYVDKGMEILKRSLRQSYDDPGVVESAKAMLRANEIQADCDSMIDEARAEVSRVNNMGVKLFEQEQGDQAAKLLMAAADRLPRNRTINTNAVKILLNLMLRHGPDDKLLGCVAKYLDRLGKLGDRSDQFRKMQRTYRELLSV